MRGYFIAERGVAITKSDTVNIDGGLTESIYVGGAGVVVVVFADDSTASYTCIAGQTLFVRAKRVNSTNTTATLMIAQW